MRRANFAFVLVTASFLPALAHAQATRTWVSGVGDDANPCSRTAPCKTFAGAISKTAAKGEIDTLDPGGFGTVTITKAIAIDGTAGLGGIASGLTNGIIINAAGADVILRNLDINGTGNGISGIVIFAAATVRVENCKIFRFSGRGIEDRRTAGHLSVTNTIVNDNGQTGILAMSGAAGTLNVSVDHVQMHGNGNSGLAITGGARAVVAHSSATSNAVMGFYADTGAFLDVEDSVAFGNANTGVMALTGATVRLSNTTVTNNSTGLHVGFGSNILSFGSNRIAGNTGSNGAPSGIVVLQ